MLALLMGASLVHAQDIILNRNIEYAEDHPRQVLDVYAPENADNLPVLMFVSGGGWTSGSKDWVRNVGVTFASLDYVVVLVDHQLLPDVDYTQQIKDLALAFTWIKENIAEYGGDPEQVVIGGHSAGGHLISLLILDGQYLAAVGYSSTDVAGVMPVSAVLSRGDPLGEDTDAKTPIDLVREDLPPFLLLVAEGDARGMRDDMATMQEKLEALDVPVQIETIADRNHFDIVQAIGRREDATTTVMYFWLRELFTVDAD